jgi:hypothetical protein
VKRMSSDDNLPLILRHQSAWQIDSLSEGHNYAPLLAKIYVSRKWPREFSTCRSPWQTRTYLISPSSPPPLFRKPPPPPPPAPVAVAPTPPIITPSQQALLVFLSEHTHTHNSHLALKPLVHLVPVRIIIE